jgi:serine/threonine-protein kinase RsbW
MKTEKFEIELESKTDNLPAISDFIDDVLTRFQADAATIYKVQLAVDEACTNVINYAYPEGAGPLKIIVESTGKNIVVTIKDKGKPFDPTSVPPPDLNPDLEQRKVGGLGIYIIKKLMDSVSYSFDPREGNRLTLQKKLSVETSTSGN